MLCNRHFYYRIFQAHILFSRTFASKWQNSPTIFGSQFMQIQQNRNTLILIKSQQFCQCNKFCSGNGEGIHFLPFEKANSSSIIFSNKLPKNNVIAQKRQHSKEHVDDYLVLETQFIELDIHNNKILRLKLQKGKSDQKFFKIYFCKNYKFSVFAHIPVPQDAYAFVRALDELIEELATENFEQKLLQIKDSQSIGVRQFESKLELKTIELPGVIHKFNIELVHFVDINRGRTRKEICLRLFAVHKNNSKESVMILPLQALPWLREQMTKMLVKHDATEAISLEAPARIPQQLFDIEVSRTDTLQNGITSGQKSENKEMWPQIAIKKPTSFQQYPKMETKIQNSNQSGFKYQKMSTHLAAQKKPNLKRYRMVKNIIKPVDPQMAELEEGIRSLFDFDDEEMEKYRRIAAKTKNPSRH